MGAAEFDNCHFSTWRYLTHLEGVEKASGAGEDGVKPVGGYEIFNWNRDCITKLILQ
jgi:hypothetical protein